MSQTPAIRCHQVSKKFARSMKRAMWYGLIDISKAAFLPHSFQSDHLSARVEDAARTPIQPASPEPLVPLRPSEFYALQDISFELYPGECIGFIGHNGAGKSTLFSVLSGIYGPTTGRIEIRGRLQALIALGAGFHPQLTGRENIYINSSVYGLTNREINAVFDEIVDFAEVGDFLDMPVKHYSSGMMVRLGFSVAVHLKPDVLIVDEVLAVGDMNFQNKSSKKIRSLVDGGTPMLFVSHYPQAVEMVANRAIWLDHGKIMQQGDVPTILKSYTDHMRYSEGTLSIPSRPETADSVLFPITITETWMENAQGQRCDRVAHGDPVTIVMKYECTHAVDTPYFSVSLKRPNSPTDFTQACMLDDDIKYPVSPGHGIVRCTLQTHHLTLGPFEVKCCIRRNPTLTAGQTHYQEPFVATTLLIDGTPGEINRPGVLHTFTLQGAMPPTLITHDWNISTELTDQPGAQL